MSFNSLIFLFSNICQMDHYSYIYLLNLKITIPQTEQSMKIYCILWNSNWLFHAHQSTVFSRITWLYYLQSHSPGSSPFFGSNHHDIKKATISASCSIDPDSRISDKTGRLSWRCSTPRDKLTQGNYRNFELLGQDFNCLEISETSCWRFSGRVPAINCK